MFAVGCFSGDGVVVVVPVFLGDGVLDLVVIGDGVVLAFLGDGVIDLVVIGDGVAFAFLGEGVLDLFAACGDGVLVGVSLPLLRLLDLPAFCAAFVCN